MQGLRSKFIKVVVDPLFFGQKNYKGLLFYQQAKGNLISQIKFGKMLFLMIPISINGPDMASVHKFWYILHVTHSFGHSQF